MYYKHAERQVQFPQGKRILALSGPLRLLLSLYASTIYQGASLIIPISTWFRIAETRYHSYRRPEELTMSQMGFFDVENRYAALDAKNGPLVMDQCPRSMGNVPQPPGGSLAQASRQA